MKVKPEAGLSATNGVATYSVIEEDRAVTWTITADQLAEMAGFDSLDDDGRERCLAGTLEPEIDDRVRGAWVRDYCVHGALRAEWLGTHARVARNTLRNYLGLPGGARALPARSIRTTTLEVAGGIPEHPNRIRIETGDRGRGDGAVGRRIVLLSPDLFEIYGPWLSDAEATALAAALLPSPTPMVEGAFEIKG